MELVKRLEQVQFGYYCSSEIRRLSVSEITQAMAFDQLQRPLKKGLYDPALGVSPYDKFNRCQTCQQEGINCQGHLGHIELLLPLYNPFLITQFMKLLKNMCFGCHRLRINSNISVHYYYQILLIKMGYIQEAIQYSQAVNNKYFRNRKTNTTVQPNQNESTNYESESNQTNKNNPEKQVQNIIKQCLKEKEQALSKLNVRNNVSHFDAPHLDTQQIQKALKDKIIELYQNVNVLVCPHCQEKAHQIKKEGFTKIFYVNRSKQQKDDEQEVENNKQMYMNPIEIREHLRKLWIKENKILSLIFGNVVINQETLKDKKGYKVISNDYNMFFIEVVGVTPNRFRPENKMDDQTFLHSHTIQLTKIININNDLKNLLLKKENEHTVKKDNLELKKDQELLEVGKINELKLQDVISKWLELQDTLNILYDSTKGGKKEDNSGIRQLFEKKQGLFRMKMMGKRVNFTARSVISPDPYLDTNEVGVPLYFAKRLTFPEGVNEHNIELLRKMVINGPHLWPGANAIECEGLKISLDTRNEQERIALANQLSQNMKNKTVLRHLMNGDPLLFNRQPTLHKPNLMSHLARVLQKENTIRMHYANCSSYNADFDGDEMNLHLVQNYVAKSETKYLSLNDHQYIVAKNGAPIRGLIQDSVLAASWLTSKDTVFDRDQFQQLLYVSLEKVLSIRNRIKIPKPCIMKPIQRYSGKQLISCILQSLVEIELQQENDQQKGMYMDKASKISKEVFGKNGQDESILYIMDNELIHGIIDKNQIGATEFGMVHSFYELYGPKMTGVLLTSLAKLFTSYLQYNGFSCGMEDLFLNKQSDIERIKLIKLAHRKGVEAQAAYVNIDYQCSEQFNLFNRPSLELSNDKNVKEIFKRQPDLDYISSSNDIINSLSKKINEVNQPEILAGLDHIVKQNLGNTTTEIFKLSNNGLRLQYPSNKFQSMVLTGAKGSTVNQNQISVMLGQQELEGKRVPITVTGRSLPSFVQYDPNPRAGGYIADRFLTGLRPQEFYFHCMAGREGLIDTAVKTSRSGYLQRCLVKHLEGLKVEYDYSVRDCDGSIFQFQYGEDGIDTQKNKFLQKYSFIQNNYNAYITKYQPKNLSSILDSKQVKNYLKQRQNNPQEYQYDTILNNFYPGSNLGAISEKANQQINQYIKDNEPQNSKKLQSLFNIKYFYSLVQPGESVGPIAAQSIGEPSTQMTLNTFHLAGHGAANVTLGIPRLREILMTAAKTIKTPCMYLPFREEEIRDNKEKAEMYKQKLQKIVLIELVKQIKIKEIKVLASDDGVVNFARHRQITIKLKFENIDAIQSTFGIDLQRIQKVIEIKFIGILLGMVHKQLRKEKTIDQNLIKIANIQEKEHQDLQQIVEEDDNDDEHSNHSEEPKTIKKEKKEKNNQEMSDKYQFLSKQMLEYFLGLNHGQDYSVIQLKVPLNCKQLLMINLVEQALEQTIVNEIKGINNCFVVKDKQKGYILQTEGVNFEKVWKQPFIDQNRIETNDIQANINYYGIEAGRQSIINEINRVFGVYHISVDYRHLAIIADYMTFLGSMRALNRIGINDHPSTFMKMTFETTMKFLCESTMQRDIETGKSPSSSIIMGRVPRLGTGVFEIRHKFK